MLNPMYLGYRYLDNNVNQYMIRNILYEGMAMFNFFTNSETAEFSVWEELMCVWSTLNLVFVCAV